MTSNMKDLIDVSREYGSDPKWVVAGGGNTSLKDGDTLYVKASGFPLATIDEDGFARVNRSKLAAIWENTYPQGDDSESVAERERLVLSDMMDSRMPGEERRPSVETQLHDLLPWPLVVHLHPTMINGLTCGVDGEAIAGELLGDRQVWIPVTDPGYVLAKVIRDELKQRSDQNQADPDFIFLANHGVFVGGQDADEIRRKYSELAEILDSRVERVPGEMPDTKPLPADSEKLKAVARDFFGSDAGVLFVGGGELNRYLGTESDAGALTGCLTPDHIVYAGPGALYLDSTGQDLSDSWKKAGAEYKNRQGKHANVILLPEYKGALVAANGEKALANAALLLNNALEVAGYSDSFGGPLLLEERFIRFIVDWEVENYRSKLASD